jgi:hypothetical protein
VCSSSNSAYPKPSTDPNLNRACACVWHYFTPSKAPTKNTIFGGYPGLHVKAQSIADSGPVTGKSEGNVAFMGTPRDANTRYLAMTALYLKVQDLQPGPDGCMLMPC